MSAQAPSVPPGGPSITVRRAKPEDAPVCGRICYDAFCIIVPTRNSDLFRWCLENGLRVVQPMTLMSSGLYNEPAGAYLPSVLF